MTAPSRGDVVAGLSVALVLVPQSLAYAVLAGMPAGTGLLVAVAAGLAAAVLTSSPYLQAGPVAITALLTFGALAPLAEPASAEYVALAAVLALAVGLVRLVIGLTRSGVLAYLMSEPVVVGFTAGAGVVIIATQIPPLVGVDGGDGPTLLVAVRVLLAMDTWDLATAGLGVAVGALLLAGLHIAPRAPWVLVVVAASITLVRVGWYDGQLVGALPSLVPTLPGLPAASALPALIVPALVIAVIGFGDVAAISRTYATATRTGWDADREFVAQGAANLAAGAVGGFPVGGSFSRTALAVSSGARSAWAGAVAALAALVAVPFSGLLADLPVTTLAGIIVASVVGLADPRPVWRLRAYSRQQFLIAAITAALTLLLAPQIQWALIVGVALAIAAHLRRELLIAVPYEVQEGTAHLHPTGVLYFASAHLLGDRMREVLAATDVDRIVVHLDRLGRVDVTGALAVRDFVREAERAGVTVELTDATPPSRKIIARVLGDG